VRQQGDRGFMQRAQQALGVHWRVRHQVVGDPFEIGGRLSRPPKLH
jgi:hypothetical protein